MNKEIDRSSRLRNLSKIGVATLAAFVLSACGGETEADGNAGGQDTGFEYGAPQEEVDAIIEDLDPVTLTYQGGANSADAINAGPSLQFQEYVEERSGGKITLDMVWGQAIAPYVEVTDALVDGRLDIAYHVPIYFPEEYPAADAYGRTTQYTTSEPLTRAPLTTEAISQAVMSAQGWNNEEHLQAIRDEGLVPLSPTLNAGDYWTACNEPGTGLDDWKGRQMRIGGSLHIPLSESLEASSVSMEYGEVYEALQRSTVDCTYTQPQVSGNTGLLEVAPYVSHLDKERMTGAATGMFAAGPSFYDLPLAYQQIIFDGDVAHLAGNLQTTVDSIHQSVVEVDEADGQFIPMESDAEALIVETQEDMVDELIQEGRLPDDIREQMAEASEKWTQIVEELGYSDEGELGNLDEWYDPGSVDFRPLAERVFLDAAEVHRPQ